MPKFALDGLLLDNLRIRFGRCLFPQASGKDIVVPPFTGERNRQQAHQWIKLYCRWAVQEGLSMDQTLLIGVEHMLDDSYGWAAQFLSGASWEDFMRGFYREYVTPDEFAIRKVQEWYRKLKERKAVPFIRFSGRELRSATNYFSAANKIGEGGFGVVYKAFLPGNQVVAVKKLKGAGKEALQQAHNEVDILSRFRHPNLVKLLGCCLEQRDPLLVYEYVPNGNLTQHLNGELGKLLSWEHRMSVALGTADAITHLHNCGSAPVYHRDVKSNNILLDMQLTAKVADFGLSKYVTSRSDVGTHITTAPQGTHGYLDPCYLQTYHLTDKSDVYSFGIVLLELVAGMKVLDLNRPEGERSIASVAINRIKLGMFDSFLDPYLKKTEPSCLEMANDVALLAMKCLSLSIEERPTMCKVAQELQCIKDDWVLV